MNMMCKMTTMISGETLGMKTEWGNPNESWLGIRCTEKKWAEKFIEEGSIKFGTAYKWIKEGKNDIGRGDPYEGLIAMAPAHDKGMLLKIRSKYPSLIEDNFKGKIIFRSQRDIHLPVFCYYSITNKHFVCPSEEGNNILEGKIPKEYFQDFKDNEPTFVIFKLAEFHSRLKGWLLNHGVKESSILLNKMQYYGMQEELIDRNVVEPYELFYKWDRFKIQQEDRIVINTEDRKILELLSEPIKIGPLNDISELADHAEIEQRDGLEVKMRAIIKFRAD